MTDEMKTLGTHWDGCEEVHPHCKIEKLERELARTEEVIQECEMALRGCRQALDATKECAICCERGEPIYEDGMCVEWQCCGEPTDLNPQLDSAIAKLAAYRERKP